MPLTDPNGLPALVGDDRSVLCRWVEPERDMDVSEGERPPRSSRRAWYAGRLAVESPSEG